MNYLEWFIIWVSVLLLTSSTLFALVTVINSISWEGCSKCDRPIKTIKRKLLCKNCKKEGFRFKTNKQIIYEAWEKKIDVEKVEEIYKK